MPRLLRAVTLASLVFSAGFLGIGRVHAQIPACALDPQSFAALHTGSQDSPDSIREELRMRKSLLHTILDCLDDEVRAQHTELERTSVTEPRMQAVRNNLLLALEDTARYYEGERERVADAGLRAAKNIAGNVREWRVNTFLPQQARIRAFVSWTYNAEFLAVAARRLEELGRGVQVLTLVDRFDIQSLFTEAEENFRAARDFHNRGQAALMNGLDPSSPIKLSLEALARTYASFITLSNRINALLPLGK